MALKTLPFQLSHFVSIGLSTAILFFLIQTICHFVAILSAAWTLSLELSFGIQSHFSSGIFFISVGSPCPLKMLILKQQVVLDLFQCKSLPHLPPY
jgi:hypothetical protein